MGIGCLSSIAKSFSLPVYSKSELVATSLQERRKAWLDFFRYGAYWVGREVPSLEGKLKPFRDDLKLFKDGISALELYGKSFSLLDSLKLLVTKRTSDAVYDAVIKGANWLSGVASALGVLRRYALISSFAFSKVMNVNMVFALAPSVDGVIKDCIKMHAARTDEQAALGLFKLLMSCAYLLFSLMQLSAPVGLVTFAVPTTTACMTLGTTLNLTSYFYERVYDPYEKNIHLNLEALRSRLQST